MSKINGITVGTPTPRSNFNQTDSKKADYIIGRENIATKEDLKNVGGTEITTLFFAEDDYSGDNIVLPHNTETDVTDVIPYKPSYSEANRDWGGFSGTAPHFRAVWKQGIASYTNEEVLPLVNAVGEWADSARLTLCFANKDYTLRLVYQYDTNNYTDLLYVKALITKEPSIGDIETALDGIIAIQEALIGGDSV
jgi:hypothetical protein